MKKMLYLPLVFLMVFLETLGKTTIAVAIAGFTNAVEFVLLILKLVWDKTVKIRKKLLELARAGFDFVASPFVKMSISFNNMRRDIKAEAGEKGFMGGVGAFFPYFAKFLFGKNGLGVTAFNYGAPIVSVMLLFNVVSYATSSNFALKLTVNGDFLGYIENEQVFLDAEAFVSQRINYYGSDSFIEIIPEFAIANIGSTETLKTHQVANLILQHSDFNLSNAYGLFIDGVCYGAALRSDDNIHLIGETLESLKNVYATGAEDETVHFLNDVSWGKYELFLDESIVDAIEIVGMVNAMKDHLPIIVTRTEVYDVGIDFATEYRPDDSLFEGSTSVSRRGVEGVERRTANVSYENGVEIRRTVTAKTVVSQPVTQIVQRGTKPHIEGVVSEQQAQYGMFIWPVVDSAGNPTGRVTPGQYFRSGHHAIDIAGGGRAGFHGTPIVAAGSGRVVKTQYSYFDYGNAVIIEHENGLRTLYAHCNALMVREGQVVTQGQQIATVGSTGRSTGPHLHFEVIDGNRRLDPMKYLPR